MEKTRKEKIEYIIACPSWDGNNEALDEAIDDEIDEMYNNAIECNDEIENGARDNDGYIIR